MSGNNSITAITNDYDMLDIGKRRRSCSSRNVVLANSNITVGDRDHILIDRRQ